MLRSLIVGLGVTLIASSDALAQSCAGNPLGACPFNRFGATCGEYNSPKRSIRSRSFHVSHPDWHP